MAEVASAAARLGRLAVWVNNAAALDPQPFADITDEQLAGGHGREPRRRVRGVPRGDAAHGARAGAG